MKIKTINITISIFLSIALFACNSANKKSNTEDNESIKKDPVQEQIVEQNKSIEEKSELLKTFNELTNSDAFKTRTETEYEWNSIGETDSSGYEIIEQKNNDYIVIYAWKWTAKVDTIVFQLLEKTDDDSFYAYNENGIAGSPLTYHSKFSVFKRNKSGIWKFQEQNIMETGLNIDVLGIFKYKPKIRTLLRYSIQFENDDKPNSPENPAVIGGLLTKLIWSEAGNKYIETEETQLPNPILIKGGGQTEGPCNFHFSAPIVKEYYNSDQIGNESGIEFIYRTKVPEVFPQINANDSIINNIINNTDTAARIFIKYKKMNTFECFPDKGYYETRTNVIEDFEIVNKSPVIATFTDFTMGDFFWYEFTSRLGYKYNFIEFSGTQLALTNNNGDGPNPELKDKKFKIWFHSKLIDNELGSGKFKKMIIDKIEEL